MNENCREINYKNEEQFSAKGGKVRVGEEKQKSQTIDFYKSFQTKRITSQLIQSNLIKVKLK
jgi:hypothetical protein